MDESWTERLPSIVCGKALGETLRALRQISQETDPDQMKAWASYALKKVNEMTALKAEVR